MARIESQGLTLCQAARKAKVSFRVLFDVVHRDPPSRVSGETLAKLRDTLALPVDLVCPALAAS